MRCLLGVLGFGLLAACAAPVTAEETKATSNDLSTDGLLGLDVEVSDTQLVMPYAGHEYLLKSQPGAVLVGRPGGPDNSKNPDGFMRQVSSVERQGDQIVIQTTMASLADVIEEGSIHQSSAAAPMANTASLGLQDVGGLLGGKLDISNSTILDEDDPLDVHLSAKVSEGYIDFSPHVDTDIKISGRHLQHFLLDASADLNAKLVMNIDVEGEGDFSKSAEGSIKKSEKKQLVKFPRMRLPPQLIGPIPVYESIELSVNLDCDLSFSAKVHTKVGFEVHGHVNAGAEYDGQWSKVGDAPSFTLTPTFDASVAGTAEATCTLAPEVVVLVYDLAGPTLSVGPYLDAKLDNTSGRLNWGVYPGVKADVGGKIEIFDHEIASTSVNVFDWKSATPLIGN